jgi:leucyl-tRNA synthetase
MLFQAPVSDVLEWDEKKITGVQRWLHRVIKLSTAPWIPSDEVKRFVVPEHVDKKLLNILQDASTSGDSKNATRESLVSTIRPDEAKLWIKTQEVIASVTESYSQTYSLNTIISDLMTLTNAIWDTPHASSLTSYLKWYSMAHLVRMLAPIAPGVAEEAWHQLNTCIVSQTDEGGVQTVFARSFPTADLAIIPLLTTTRKCVVQIDGKRKFDVDIQKLPESISPKDSNAVTKFVLGELVQTDEGREWFDRQTGKIWKLSATEKESEEFEAVPEGWKVIAVNGGALCNFVGPKKPKIEKSR